MQVESCISSEMDLVIATEIYNSLDNNAVIALSGGRTPFKMYSYLFKLIARRSFPKIHVIQVDERWTNKDNNRANQKTIQELLSITESKNITFHQIALKNELDTVKEAAEQYKNKLKAIFADDGTIDYLFLGMGIDGHTASLFPMNSDYLADLRGEKDIVFSTYEETQKESRITISTEMIRSAKKIIILIKGAEKGRIFARARKTDNKQFYPISIAFLDQTTVYMDAEAYQIYTEEMLMP